MDSQIVDRETGQETGEEIGEKNVNLPELGRDSKGRWIKGHSGWREPTTSKALLAQINESMPPARVAQIIDQSLRIAHAKGSWRGMLATLELCLNYQIGKPVQRRLTVEGNTALQSILAQLRGDGEAAIDGEVTEDNTR